MKDKSLTLKSLLATLNEIAPFSMAEAWDNVGLMVGGPQEHHVTGIMVALDPTEALLDEALARKANTIVTHHPLIFHPLKAIATDQPLGRIIKKALAHNMNLIACHTNLDVIATGVSAILAEKLGLQNCTPLEATSNGPVAKEGGLGMIGRYAAPCPVKNFTKRLLATLQQPFVQITGALPKKISTVALCGGSGSDLAEKALQMGAQVFITAEVKHHIARWAEAENFCIIDGGHFATEWPAMPRLVELLQKALAPGHGRTKIFMSREQGTPFRLLHT